MKKTLLLSPPYLTHYMRNARCDFISLSGTQWFPILLGYCGAFLEKRGYDVKLIDAPAYNLTFKDVERLYLDYKPDFLVVYPGDKSRNRDIEFTDFLLSRYRVPAIFAGPYYSMDSGYFLKNSKMVYFGAEGEFEYPIWEWMEGKTASEIKNIVVKKEDAVVKNEIRPYLSQRELDDIPFVSEFFNRQLNFKYYKTHSEPNPFVDIMTGRGCRWGLCTFCLWPHTYVKGSVYNMRSIENVMDELEFIERKMRRIRSVMIQDDTFPRERIMEFCMAKIERGIKTKWSCYARADLDLQTLRLMKKAGCLNLHVGFESANNNILKKIKKGLDKERMIAFAADSKKAGLRIHGDFLIGLPGDDENSVGDLIRLARAINPYTAQFQIFIPFKGTPIYEELKGDGYLKDGIINYPYLSAERIEHLSKLAYRKFYLSIPFLLAMLRHPINLLFKKIKTIRCAFPSITWKRLNIR